MRLRPRRPPGEAAAAGVAGPPESAGDAEAAGDAQAAGDAEAAGHPESAADAAPAASGVGVRSRRRILLVIGAVAVVALGVGLAAGQFIRSPADAASRAESPEAAPITVPVERRELASQVTTRGDVAFAGSVEVELELGALDTPPVVTGHVPERGDELTAGEPALEVVGRPVLALPGELPMYRSLRPGMSGPDVEQLKQALRAVGLDPGGEDDQYRPATAAAVAQLFDRAGYPPPEPDQEAQAELAAAEEAVATAEQELDAAEQSLAALENGPQAAADPELIAAEQAVEQAAEQLTEAEEAEQQAQTQAGTPLPAAEVYYFPELPQQVHEVQVARGDLAEGEVMAVSGADLQVTADLSEADRELLSEGMTALLDLPGGEVEGTVAEIRAADGGERHQAVITPPELSPEQVDELPENLRVQVPVGSTEGEVLAVPLAALTAGAGHEARVEVVRDGDTDFVIVDVGLVAEGYAEVIPVDQELAEGDLVVVGE